MPNSAKSKNTSTDEIQVRQFNPEKVNRHGSNYNCSLRDRRIIFPFCADANFFDIPGAPHLAPLEILLAFFTNIVHTLIYPTEKPAEWYIVPTFYLSRHTLVLDEDRTLSEAEKQTKANEKYLNWLEDLKEACNAWNLQFAGKYSSIINFKTLEEHIIPWENFISDNDKDYQIAKDIVNALHKSDQLLFDKTIDAYLKRKFSSKTVTISSVQREGVAKYLDEEVAVQLYWMNRKKPEGIPVYNGVVYPGKYNFIMSKVLADFNTAQEGISEKFLHAKLNPSKWSWVSMPATYDFTARRGSTDSIDSMDINTNISDTDSPPGSQSPSPINVLPHEETRSMEIDSKPNISGKLVLFNGIFEPYPVKEFSVTPLPHELVSINKKSEMYLQFRQFVIIASAKIEDNIIVLNADMALLKAKVDDITKAKSGENISLTSSTTFKSKLNRSKSFNLIPLPTEIKQQSITDVTEARRMIAHIKCKIALTQTNIEALLEILDNSDLKKEKENILGHSETLKLLEKDFSILAGKVQNISEQPSNLKMVNRM